MLDFEIHLQRQVIALGLDDASPNAMLPNTHGGQFGTTRGAWQEAVIDFIREMLEEGLLAPLAGQHEYQRRGAEEIAAFLQSGDAEHGIDVELFWSSIYFDGTDKLRALLKSLSLDNWDALNFELSSALGKELAEMNVVSIRKRY
jgi:hypothetical protein